MAIVQADIKFFLSGGAGNSDPNLSLGGAISATELVAATVGNLFDNVSGAESAAGDVEYRCFYVKNDHASLTLQAAKAFINTNTPSADSDVSFSLGTSAVNGTEQTAADESTPPAGVTWQNAIGEANSQSIGDIPFGQTMAIWLRRTITAAASAYNSDSVITEVKGDTAA